MKTQEYAVLVARVHEMEMYLDRYKFPDRFWIWALDGVDPVTGHRYFQAAVSREVTREEVESMIRIFAGDMHEQIWTQQELSQSKAVPDPMKWGENFVGKNSSHKGQLRKERMGLYAVRDLYVHYKEQALWNQRQDAKQMLDEGPLFMTRPLQEWPPNPDKLFSDKMLTIERMLQWEVSREVCDSWRQDPGVMAGETKVIGWCGKIVATAANQLKSIQKAM